ncbi:MAG: TonB-dependent receptor plug domain-containing protein [Deltaproteobacteria bacterium]|jgi:iron complex outermembrane receptor protein|nr:TonB-dependent receptor plug domain-containing protein [Deltaproteobacteria bacterium]
MKLFFKLTAGAAVLSIWLAAALLTAQESRPPAREEGSSPKTPPSQGSLTAVSLPEINVYGVAELPPSVPVTTNFGTQFNVVTEEQIRRQNSLYFLDSLRNVPGVMYQKRNLIGSQTSHSLYMRGRGASHPGPDLSVFFDEIPRSGFLYGQALGDGIPVYALGGMEIYKYPQPTRFGTGYGMINFIPKYMSEEGMELRTGFQGGSYGTFAENVSFGIKKGPFDIFAAQSWISSDGHLEHSRAQQQSYYLNTGYALTENWSVRLLVNAVDAQTLMPEDPASGARRYPDRFDTETFFTTFTVINKYDNASGYAKFYFNDTKFLLLNENGGARWSEQRNKMSGVRVRETLNLWEGGEAVAGFDLDRFDLTNTQFVKNDHSQDRVWDFPNQTIFSPYLGISQYIGSPEGLHAIPSAGIRYYRNSVFAEKSSPQAGLILGFGNTDLNFNYARGVNYPSPVALQGLIPNQGVPASLHLSEVKPEVADHYEIGLNHKWPETAALGITYFADRGRDRYRVFMGPFNNPTSDLFTYRANRYKIQGVELTGSAKPLASLEIFGGATWLKAEASGEDGITRDKMPYTPDFAFQGGFNWNIMNLNKFRLSGDFQHLEGIYSSTSMRTGGSYGDLAGLELDDINVFNLRLGYSFSHEPMRLESAEIFLAVDNVFNEKYAFTLAGNPPNTAPELMPGTTFMIGADFKFK